MFPPEGLGGGRGRSGEESGVEAAESSPPTPLLPRWREHWRPAATETGPASPQSS